MFDFGNWKPDLCIYHDNCDDGFAAALLVWRQWPHCDFVPGRYGKPLPDMTGRQVLFVDFSAPENALREAGRTATSVIILDHHKTAEADLAPFRAEVENGFIRHANGDAGTFNGICIEHMSRGETPIFAFFDGQRSGASLTWLFLTGASSTSELPRFVDYIEDRDLWRFSRGDETRMFSAALRSYPQDFAIWDKLWDHPDELIADGGIILRAHRANMKRIMAETHWRDIAGYRVPVVNAPYHYASDLGNELLGEHPDAPFAATWFHRGDGIIQCSLRSDCNRVDVSEIARMLKGGGHRNSAGFQQPAVDFFAEVARG